MLWSELHHRRQVLPRGDAPLLPSLQHRLLAELRVPVHLVSGGRGGGVGSRPEVARSKYFNAILPRQKVISTPRCYIFKVENESNDILFLDC